jgi:hypothetical protein
MKKRSRTSAARRLGRISGALAVTAAASGGLLAAAQSAHAATNPAPARSYTYTTLDNAHDPTFNQLLGINNTKVIAGYFGSGATGHPNKGYTVSAPYGQANYVDENFPGSRQTQVTSINNRGDTAGFWVNGQNTNRGFVEWNGVFASYRDPLSPTGPGSVNQILGINDAGLAVGFYNDAIGNSHPFEVNQATGHFTQLKTPGRSSVATGINDAGDIVGVYTNASGTFGWLLHAGHLTAYSFPGGSDTQALGVNKNDEIVGSYVDGAGNTHGFTLADPLGPVSHWNTIDDPNALNTPGAGTVVNGVNNAGDLVGFYTDPAGNVDGFLAQ